MIFPDFNYCEDVISQCRKQVQRLQLDPFNGEVPAVKWDWELNAVLLGWD
jgi:hypothetical protein